MKITLKAPEAQLKKINTRTEGPQTDPIPAEDLKFHGMVDGSFLQTLLGTDTAPDFWHDGGDQDGKLKYLGLTTFGSYAELQGCTMKWRGITLKNAKAKKFAFKLHGGRQIELTLTVQARPDDEAIKALRHAQLQYGELVLTTEQAVDYSENDDGQESMDV